MKEAANVRPPQLAAVARPSTSLNLRSGFFDHGRESFLDGFKWNADKVGVPWLPPVSRPGSIMVSRACDIGDVVLGAGYPPEVGISIMLADSKSHGTLLLLIDLGGSVRHSLSPMDADTGTVMRHSHTSGSQILVNIAHIRKVKFCAWKVKLHSMLPLRE